jgi:hypothetical protein
LGCRWLGQVERDSLFCEAAPQQRASGVVPACSIACNNPGGVISGHSIEAVHGSGETVMAGSLLFLCGRIFQEGDDCLVVVNQAADKVLHDEFGILAGACSELIELGFDLRRKPHFHQPLV